VTAIILPSIWTKQPQGAVGVDLSRSPVCIINHGVSPGYDAVGNNVWPYVVAPKSFISVFGKAYKSSNWGTSNYSFTVSKSLDGSKELSIIVCGALYPNERIVTIPTTAWDIKLSSSGSGVMTLDLLGGGYGPRFTATFNVPVVGTVVINWSAPNNLNVFSNGVKLSHTVVTDTTVSSIGNIGRFYIFDGGAYAVNAPIALVGVFNKVQIDAQELSTNPWQIFKPRKRILYFDAPSFPVLTSLAVSAITSSGGRLTAN